MSESVHVAIGFLSLSPGGTSDEGEGLVSVGVSPMTTDDDETSERVMPVSAWDHLIRHGLPDVLGADHTLRVTAKDLAELEKIIAESNDDQAKDFLIWAAAWCAMALENEDEAPADGSSPRIPALKVSFVQVAG